jgi:hypothetical protein
MSFKRQTELTKAEVELRRELEVRFSRVLAEVLRQPRSDGVPDERWGSACAVAIFRAINYVCPLAVMDDLLHDYFEESFTLLTHHLLDPSKKMPLEFEQMLKKAESPATNELVHEDASKETREISLDPSLIALTVDQEKKPQ